MHVVVHKEGSWARGLAGQVGRPSHAHRRSIGSAFHQDWTIVGETSERAEHAWGAMASQVAANLGLLGLNCWTDGLAGLFV